MNPLRILVVDDERLARDRLITLLEQCPDVVLAGSAADGAEAMECIVETAPDLVLLDIQMPARSGLAVAADLPADARPEIVFVTAFEQFATDAFAVDATDYLMKPVRFDRLRQALERARRRRDLREAAKHARPATDESVSVNRNEGEIWVQVRDGTHRLAIADIDWIEAARDYVLLHTATRSYIHRSTMVALEKALGGNDLMRVHRSAFARPALVDHVRRHMNGSLTLTLRDGANVPVGPSYVKALSGRLGLGQGDRPGAIPVLDA